MPTMQLRKKSVYINENIDRFKNGQEINVDFRIPVIVESKIIDWEIAPIIGIRQECFERTQGGKSCLTVLTQLPAGQTFKKSGHEGGIEFFILSGSCSDSDGDYSAGYYVRNAAGRCHKFYTDSGCTVLFKLGHFQPLDRNRVVIDTMSPSVRWQPIGEPGISCLSLHDFSEEGVYLYRIRPECWVTFKLQKHGLELFVCKGSIAVKGNRYVTGAWLRYPAGSRVKVSAVDSVYLYVKKNIFPKTKFSSVSNRVGKFKC